MKTITNQLNQNQSARMMTKSLSSLFKISRLFKARSRRTTSSQPSSRRMMTPISILILSMHVQILEPPITKLKTAIDKRLR